MNTEASIASTKDKLQAPVNDFGGRVLKDDATDFYAYPLDKQILHKVLG